MVIDIVLLFGSSLVGAILEQLIRPSHLRWDLRGEVSRSVANVENNRWAQETREAFDDAVSELRSAVLVARLQKPLASLYIELASQARMLSEQDLWEFGSGDVEIPAGMIPAELSELVCSAAESLVAYASNPFRARLSMGRTLRRLEREKAGIVAVAQPRDERRRFGYRA